MLYTLAQVHTELLNSCLHGLHKEQRPCYQVLLSIFFPIHLGYCNIFSPSSASFLLTSYPLCFSPSMNGSETKGDKNQEKSN